MTPLELTRGMWKSGLSKVEAERKAKHFEDPEYFARLEAVVTGIKTHLAKHELLKEFVAIVKHGESTMQVTVDLPGMIVLRDPLDPKLPFFHIPVTKD